MVFPLFFLQCVRDVFIRAVAVPEMQIKLKQGFGRTIRTETA